MNIAKKYKVKLLPLTDIRIGSGKDIEAYEYTVKAGYMYRIDMSEVFDKMSDSEKGNFRKILKKNNLFNIRSWIYNNYREEWGYIYKEKVSSDFEKYYKEKIDDRSQDNSQLSISEFIGYDDKKYIPGSSIKGALRTAFIYSDFLENRKKYQIKKNRNEAQIMEANILNAERIDRNQKLTGLEPKKDPFKMVKIFDTKEIELKKFSVNELKIKEGKLFCEILEGKYSEIKETKKINFEEGINFDIVLTEYSFKNNFKIDYKKSLGIRELLDSLDTKMENILNFEIEKEREKDSYNTKEFYEFLKKIFNSFKNKNINLIRIGKYTGFNDKTINLVTENPSEKSRTIFDENKYPMGWALIKVEEVNI